DAAGDGSGAAIRRDSIRVVPTDEAATARHLARDRCRGRARLERSRHSRAHSRIPGAYNQAMRRALFCVALFATMPALAQTDVAVKLSGASYSSTDLALDPAGTAKVTFKNKLGYGASVSHYWT